LPRLFDGDVRDGVKHVISHCGDESRLIICVSAKRCCRTGGRQAADFGTVFAGWTMVQTGDGEGDGKIGFL
jgi:hypothetical protein